MTQFSWFLHPNGHPVASWKGALSL